MSSGIYFNFKQAPSQLREIISKIEQLEDEITKIENSLKKICSSSIWSGPTASKYYSTYANLQSNKLQVAGLRKNITEAINDIIDNYLKIDGN